MSASEGNEGAGDGGRPSQTPTQRRLAGISSYVIDSLEKQHPGVFLVKKRSEPFVTCTKCNVTVSIKCGVKDANAHCKSAKHQKALAASKGQVDLFSSGMDKKRNQPIEEDEVLNAEILMSQFISSANIGFNRSQEFLR